MFRDFYSFRAFLKAPSLSTLSHNTSLVLRAQSLIGYYYAVIPFIAFFYAASPLKMRENFDPLWPLAWSSYFNFDYITTLSIVSVFFIGTALFGAFFYRYRIMRTLVFIGLWQMHAFESSFGSPNHQWYMWVFTALILIFLPHHKHASISTDSKRIYLLYVWGIQAIVALMYSMAGLMKVLEAIHQYLLHQVHGFSVEAFAYQIAYFVPRLQEEAVLASLIVEHPILGWIPYVSIILIQVSSLWIMVRPSLQKAWAFAIVLFHFLTYFTMGISFHPQILLVIILFFQSPFAEPYKNIRECMNDIPLVGQVLSILERRKAKV